jgi:hypothetical protein
LVAGSVIAVATVPGAQSAGSKEADQATADVLRGLAEAVEKDWQDERVPLGPDYPYLLPVRWERADKKLVDSWSLILNKVTSQVGWPQPPSAGWLPGPEQLAGQGGELASVLLRVPTGRLLILGEPGSGKTVLMMRVVLDLLERRKAGEPLPVPVLLPAASWNPSAQQGLFDWVADQLAITYPAVTASADRAGAARIFRALLDERLIMPFLDGLDEVQAPARKGDRTASKPAGRTAAERNATERMIAGINKALRPGHRIVVACRTADFRHTVTRPQPPSVTLGGAAGIELCPLDLATAVEYLDADGAGRWLAALADLPDDAPLRAALSSPLLVSLARTVCSPPAAEFTPNALDPRTLGSLASLEDVQEALFGQYVAYAYRDTGTTDYPGQWLGFLADRLNSSADRTNFAWWKLPDMMSRRAASAFTGLVAGAVTALGVIISCAVFVAIGLDVYHLQSTLHYKIQSPAEAWRFTSEAGVPLALAGAGLATAALAFLLTPPSTKLRPDPPFRVRVRLLALGSLAAGGMVTYATWHYIGPYIISPVLLGVGMALIAVVIGGRLVRQGRTDWSRNEDLLRAVGTGLIVGVMAGFLFGIAFTAISPDFGKGLAWARTWGVITGICAFIGGTRKSGRSDQPSLGAQWNGQRVVAGAVLAGVAAVLITVWIPREAFGKPLALAYCILFAFAGGIGFGLERRAPEDEPLVARADVMLARDRRATLLLTPTLGLSAGLSVAGSVAIWVASYKTGAAAPPTGEWVTAGLATGLSLSVLVAVGFAITALGTTWPRWLMARTWLALTGRLPWRLLTSLESARERGILRQAGPYYQFRHLGLQEYLAARYAKTRPDRGKARPLSLRLTGRVATVVRFLRQPARVWPPAPAEPGPPPPTSGPVPPPRT